MPTLKTVDEYINLKPVAADKRLTYGDDPEQFGDLYLPKQSEKPVPVIVLLHGGCWRAAHSLLQLGELCRSITGLGYAVWNLEYRRLGNGGGWPTTFTDVAKGTDYLTSIATEYSLDLTQVITMGHSAGGHLALWLANRTKLTTDSELYTHNPLNVSAVISLAGIPDLESGVTENICRGACQELMGGLPEEYPERYQQGSPHHLSLSKKGMRDNFPQIHLLGELDPIVPLDYLKTALNQQQDQYTLQVIPDIGHFEMVMPDTVSWPYIKRSLEMLNESSS
ncbi:alpha/beta hydrolase [Cocleimonas sp. KMM 6892]|uniref:alpha/beta hydrolase n=1 Tax=unclassified Cocleimonas TaxID=2639732 RepID=UPI002DB9BB54|nr:MULTISPECIES: alpha/beta hydrolase [unclassified Cocleimonas]MEB8434217.1 alpha/beta hydrolase [Cocleimonas sp. KMM 6892]MEC4717164.1 alpha/beta hydrolase [Cocleimonas sp. KMM 6895]MEC4746489.1 alpha/beta hydrolase [Cocleimonas sp. KMM 6896]